MEQRCGRGRGGACGRHHVVGVGKQPLTGGVMMKERGGADIWAETKGGDGVQDGLTCGPPLENRKGKTDEWTRLGF
jgi:hypothetical protein